VPSPALQHKEALLGGGTSETPSGFRGIYGRNFSRLIYGQTANPAYMRSNAQLDFEISQAEMAALRAFEPLKDYGEYTAFPVYSGK